MEEITKSSSSDFSPQLKRSAPPWEFSSRRCSSRIAAPDLDESASPSPSAAEIRPLPNRTWLRLCGCSFAVLLMAAMLFLILLFTAFRINDPVVSLAGISGGSLSTNRTANATILADVKIRNPNAAAFRFVAGVTTIYLGETVIGEAATPPGKVKARGTVHLRVAVELMGEKLSGATRSRLVRMFCITRIPGDVKVIMKKHMVVKVNCQINYDYVKRELTAGDCEQFVIS
ncbi:Late embryogenesis abundant protein At1g64065 [Linum perenne]